MQELNIIISGVGGQGNVLLERVIGKCAILAGFNVRASDTYGAAQRGGSVISQIRLGKKVRSSLIPQGKCDIIIGLEPGEALRAVGTFLVEGGLVIINTSPILPAKVKTGEWKYPSGEEILGILTSATSNVIHLDATLLAKQAAGAERYMNMVMAGAFASQEVLPVDIDAYKACIKELTGNFASQNISAFDAGLISTGSKRWSKSNDKAFGI